MPSAPVSPISPHLDLEAACWARGLARVAGVDEAGRGAWAGPVAVAAVILPPQPRAWPFRDSKTLSPARRADLAEVVKREALAWAVEFAPPAEVDEFNVLGATKRAALRALERLDPAPQALITDYLHLATTLPLTAIPRADGTSLSVAAASILAKTARDALMVELEARYPGYGLAAHKGYGAPRHKLALAALGPCEVHRRSFAPVKRATLEQSWQE